MLTESKIDVLQKIVVITGGTLTEVHTIGALIKVFTNEVLIGACKIEVDKIVELDATLTANVPNSGAKEEEVYSLVDEVVDTSIKDTLS